MFQNVLRNTECNAKSFPFSRAKAVYGCQLGTTGLPTGSVVQALWRRAEAAEDHTVVAF